MRTIFTARWINSPATGWAWKATLPARLPQAVRLVLYDLTSVYFEGRGRSIWPDTATAGITEAIGPKSSWR